MFSASHKAELDFCKLVKPVADFLRIPEDETQVVLMNDAATWVDIRDWKALSRLQARRGATPPHPGPSPPHAAQPPKAVDIASWKW